MGTTAAARDSSRVAEKRVLVEHVRSANLARVSGRLVLPGLLLAESSKDPIPLLPQPEANFRGFKESDMLPDTALVRRSFERSSDGQSGAGVK